jgi:pyruvate dehydrogenase E2 component (dihydrolipoamide acetyltransferase)
MTDITMPALSPTMEKGTLAKWRVAPGDPVKSGDIIAEIETDKATMEIEAADEGFVTALLVAEGTEDIPVGRVIATLGEQGAAAKPAPAAAVALPPVAASAPRVEAAPPPKPRLVTEIAAAVKATPLARRLAYAEGIDLSRIKGSGPNGRIVKLDIVPRRARAAAAPAFVVESLPVPDVPHETVKLSTMRKTIARRLSQAKRDIPHFYLSIDVRLDALLALRTQLNAALTDAGAKISVNDLLIKALGRALERVPDAHVQLSGDELIKFSRADISVAVAIEGGLVTPIIKDAAYKSLSALAAEMKDLAARARDGKLKPEEYQGGTASLSNLGMYGIKEMVPVINPPQALILGIGAGEKRPYAENDTLILATVMTATGSFDHRAIDGATGAKVMAAFKVLVENPLQLLI